MNDKHPFTSRPISSPSDSESSTQVPCAFAPRPLAVALRRVLGGGLLAVGLVGPALGQSQDLVTAPASVPSQSQSLDLSTLNGGNGFAFNSPFSNGFVLSPFSSVSGAGDVNGDGFDDIIIGAPDADPNGFRSGQSYVVFGSSGGFPAAVELSDLDGGNGFVLNGAASDSSGWSVSGAGDVNGDGFDDVIIGAPGTLSSRPYLGQSYVVFGTPSARGSAALFKGLLADVGALGLPAGLERWLIERCGDLFNGSGLCSGSRLFQRPKATPPPRGF